MFSWGSPLWVESCPQPWPPPPSCLSAPFFYLLPGAGPFLATSRVVVRILVVKISRTHRKQWVARNRSESDLNVEMACLLIWVRWIPQSKRLLTLAQKTQCWSLLQQASLLPDFFVLRKRTLLCNQCILIVEKFYRVNKQKANPPTNPPVV